MSSNGSDLVGTSNGRETDRFAFSLDPRLAAVAALVPEGARLWDVGSDHARLPVWLLRHGKIAGAVASDIAAGPLEAARSTARRYDVDDSMEFRLCDGLPQDAQSLADTVSIAGMGGGTIAAILRAAPWTRGNTLLLLQPMSSAEELRDMLYGDGYRVLDEVFVRDGRHRYIIIVARGAAPSEKLSVADRYAGRFCRDADHVKQVVYHLRNMARGKDDYLEAITQLEGEIC